MIEKTIKYTDYHNQEREEKFCFNLSKAELAEMELSTEGGLAESIQKIVDAKDVPQIIQIFKKLLLASYGEVSADGKRFIKSKEISDAFAQTEAYSELFMQLATNADAASEFINGITSSIAKKEEKKLTN